MKYKYIVAVGQVSKTYEAETPEEVVLLFNAMNPKKKEFVPCDSNGNKPTVEELVKMDSVTFDKLEKERVTRR